MTKEEKLLRREQRERRKEIEKATLDAGRGPVDVPFLLLTLLLTGIGLIMLLSASFPSAYYEDGNPFLYFRQQAIFAAGGIAAMLFLGRFNYARLRGLATLGIVVSVVLLFLVAFTPLGVTRNHATRWIGFRDMALFQPSEILKAAVILYFADTISKKKDKMRSLRHGILPYVVILGIIVFLLWKEPHVSAIVLVCGIAAAMLFVGGIRFIWVGGAAALFGGAVYAYLRGWITYNSSRIRIWQDPLNTEWMRGDGYQIRQSLLSIGSGGLLGVGLGKSRQKFLFLPEEHNDFIFSVICEELGFIGAALIIVLFMLLIFRGYWIALHARDRFGSLLAVGVTTQLALQVFLNIAVATSLIPATGISLPFFSYGGTALLVQLAEMGVVLSVSRQMPAS